MCKAQGATAIFNMMLLLCIFAALFHPSYIGFRFATKYIEIHLAPLRMVILLILAIIHTMLSSVRSGSVRNLQWDDISSIVKLIVPPLVSHAYKGQNGRVAIVGGSPDYTGAPYYAGQGSLKFGADLAFIFCAKEAAGPIKSYRLSNS